MIKNCVYSVLAIICFCYGNFAHASLLFSEYVEGSSYNKALEIYNTGGDIDFNSGLYSIAIYTNGSSSVSRSISLSGSIASDSTFVIANSRADAGVLSLADLTSGSLSFNGDDAIVLLENGTIIDSIGQIGVDPGTAWGSGSETTMDATLRRMSTISVGDSNTFDVFDPASQWTGYAVDDFSGLGWHSVASTLPVSTLTVAAVPEPNTLFLAGVGLLLVMMMTGRLARHKNVVTNA